MKRRQRITYRHLTVPWRRWPLLFMVIEWWVVLYILVFRVDPSLVKDIGVSDGYIILPIVLFFCFILSASLVSKKLWRSLLWSFLLTIFVTLRIFQLGSVLNLILLAAFGAAVEFYFYTKDLPVTSD